MIGILLPFALLIGAWLQLDAPMICYNVLTEVEKQEFPNNIDKSLQ
ncbi:MAG TPA: hypothetical protein VEY71_11130 [Chitinophagales bacterium]|nr:hypothetical protein [Chitinophagales bacterium]